MLGKIDREVQNKGWGEIRPLTVRVMTVKNYSTFISDYNNTKTFS